MTTYRLVIVSALIGALCGIYLQYQFQRHQKYPCQLRVTFTRNTGQWGVDARTGKAKLFSVRGNEVQTWSGIGGFTGHSVTCEVGNTIAG